jgi:DNA-binding transcriptional ArsR family regulator
MQKEELVITNPEAARALRDTPMLAQFLEPKSPSEVAKKIGQPANLVHHHAKRGLELGLLLEDRREGGRVYYQLAARAFKYDRFLLTPDESEGSQMRDLMDAFLNAYTRSDHIAGNQDPDYATHGFAHPSDPLEKKRPRNYDPGEPETPEVHPAHYSARTFKLGAARYRALVQEIAHLIIEAEKDDASDAGYCTFAFLAFDGITRELHEDSQTINSFVPV